MGAHDEFAAFERESWETVAAAYEWGFSRLTREFLAPLLDAASVRPGMDVLDVAAGPGHGVAAAAARGARAVGVDFADAMVAQARRLHPGLEFRSGDAEALPFGDASFDAVTCNFGMPHFAHPGRVAAEACRVLRPGGRWAFSTWAEASGQAAFAILFEAVATHGRMDVPLPEGPPMWKYADPAVARELFADAGLGDVRSERHEAAWRLESPDHLFLHFVEGTARSRGLLRAQSPEDLEEIRAAMRAAVERHASGDGYELSMAAWIHSAGRP